MMIIIYTSAVVPSLAVDDGKLSEALHNAARKQLLTARV
jgi:hypothetical protein